MLLIITPKQVATSIGPATLARTIEGLGLAAYDVGVAVATEDSLAQLEAEEELARLRWTVRRWLGQTFAADLTVRRPRRSGRKPTAMWIRTREHHGAVSPHLISDLLTSYQDACRGAGLSRKTAESNACVELVADSWSRLAELLSLPSTRSYAVSTIRADQELTA